MQHLVVIARAAVGQDRTDLTGARTATGQPSSLCPRTGVCNWRDAVSVEGAAKPSRAMGGRDSAGVDRRPVNLTTQKQPPDRMCAFVSGQVENLQLLGLHLG